MFLVTWFTLLQLNQMLDNIIALLVLVQFLVVGHLQNLLKLLVGLR